MMRDALLFNCCTGYEEPNWRRFKSLELAGCRDRFDNPGETLGSIPAREASFFTIYGRLPSGEAEAITDVHDPREALAIAGRLAVRSGLRVFLSITLAGNA